MTGTDADNPALTAARNAVTEKFRAGSFVEARDLCRAALDKGFEPLFFGIFLVDCHLALLEHAEALEVLGFFGDPAKIGAQIVAGEILARRSVCHARLGGHAMALADGAASRAILTRASPASDSIVSAILAEGEAAYALKDDARSRDCVVWAMRLPGSTGRPSLHENLGNVYARLGQPVRSLLELERAAAENPSVRGRIIEALVSLDCVGGARRAVAVAPEELRPGLLALIDGHDLAGRPERKLGPSDLVRESRQRAQREPTAVPRHDLATAMIVAKDPEAAEALESLARAAPDEARPLDRLLFAEAGFLAAEMGTPNARSCAESATEHLSAVFGPQSPAVTLGLERQLSLEKNQEERRALQRRLDALRGVRTFATRAMAWARR
jgi:hypothetical protein